MSETGHKIRKAKKQIARILQQLECDTGMAIECIGLRDIDVTTTTDDSTRILRDVTIELRRVPGTRWAL